MEAIKSRPGSILCVPEIWGFLIKEAYCADEIRQALLAVAERSTEDFYFARTFVPFEVRLPGEEKLLPHLLRSVVEVNSSQFAFELSGEDINLKVRNMTLEYICNVDQLIAVAESPHSSRAVRGAAICFYIFHPKVECLDLDLCERVLFKAYDDRIGWWLVKAASLGLTMRLTSGAGPETFGIIGKLMMLARDDYTTRSSMDGLMNNWRQTSHAPVHQITSGIF